MSKQYTFRALGFSQPGRKHEMNEDAFLCLPEHGLFIVCDGMGGKTYGAQAASVAMDKIRNFMVTKLDRRTWPMDTDGTPQRRQGVHDLLRGALLEANRAIHELTRAEWMARGMGTTASVLQVLGRCAFVGHVGHGRIYLLRGQRLHRITEDHTVLAEIRQRKHNFDEATLKKLPYRNSLTRTLGPQPTVDPDLMDLELLPGDRFLMCTDGLHNQFEDEPHRLAELVQAGSLQDAPRRLVEYVAAAGETDDATAVVLEALPEQPVSEEITHSLFQRFTTGITGLGQVELFQHLDEPELLRLVGISEECEFKAGEAIVREGETGDTMFVILRGQVSVIVGGRIVNTLGEGKHFGEMALLTQQPRTATVRADTPVVAKSIRREKMNVALRENPVLANKVLWNMVHVLSARLTEHSRLIASQT